ncbi:MAG TPA: glutathione S-transferase [Oceanospirillales bacterium]|nr:glutathione S-transferase [Oceanospirillales bacterium]
MHSSKDIILYSFRRCPYAIRARMALAYAGIDYQHREILLKDKPQSMLDYSAKATVPVLIVKDRVVDESLDIMLWAVAQNDVDGWMQKQPLLELVQLCDEKFKPQLDKYKYADRYEHSREYYRQQSMWFLSLLDQQLATSKQLFSDKISLADVAIFPFIRQYAFVDKPWFDYTEFKNLQSWLAGHLHSGLFMTVMKKLPLWRDKCN